MDALLASLPELRTWQFSQVSQSSWMAFLFCKGRDNVLFSLLRYLAAIVLLLAALLVGIAAFLVGIRG